MNKTRLMADIAYQDYAVLIAHMDGEPAFRGETTGGRLSPFMETSKLFSDRCRQYRNGMKTAWRNFNDQKSHEADPYDSFLYNPVSFMTFGDTDCVSLVAIDDFEPTIYFTSQSTVPVQQTCLAFCPDLKSLGLETVRTSKDDPDAPRVFCHISDLCTPEKRSSANRRDRTRLISLFDSPLIGISYFKLNGMAILGPGLLFQQEIYRAAAKIIANKLERMRRFASSDRNEAGLFSVSDVDSFRCIVLDPQGWSDISMLMFASNYTVIMSVLVDLRQITFKKLYNTIGGDKLKDAIRCFPVHKAIADEAVRIARSRGLSVQRDDLLCENHVFCSTYTTLGISMEEFVNRRIHFNGMVIADTEIELDPGHLQKVRKLARDKVFIAKPVKKFDDTHFNWCKVGQNDVELDQLVTDGGEKTNPVKLVDLVKQIISVRDCDKDFRQNPDECLAPHILSVSTTLKIPILLPSWDMREDSHMDMRSVLSALEQNLFLKTNSRFEIKKLYDSLRKIGVSAPLSHAVLNLFSDFAKCIGDPFLFERVLDLYDVFCASYQLLARELPSELNKMLPPKQTRTDYGHTRETFLDEKDIDDLVELVQLLDNALTKRTQLRFRDAKRWSPSLDIKGGAPDKLVNAADSPLKCGLGILRRVMNGWTKALEPPDKVSDEKNALRIGGTTQISCKLRSLSHQLRIGPVDSIFLSSIDLNTIHLTRPSAFCIHLHETAHLICELLGVGKSKCHRSDDGRAHKICYKNRGRAIKDSYEQYILERQQDIFSEILVHYFVFGNDYTTYFRYYLANYSLDSIAYVENDKDGFRRLLEVLIRGYLITEPFRARERGDKSLYSLEEKEPSDRKLKQIFRLFKAAVVDAGPFYAGFKRLWRESEPGFEDYVEQNFIKVYHSTWDCLCCIWKDAQDIFCGVTQSTKKHKYGTDRTNEPGAIEEVIDTIRNGISEGKPLIRTMYKIRGRIKPNEQDNRLDPFLLVRLLLKEYITLLFGTTKKAAWARAKHLALRGVDSHSNVLCLARHPRTGRPDPSGLSDGKRWHTQLIDRHCNGLFAVDPYVRRDYIKSRIVVIKTLWDISSNLRARRLERMLDMASKKRPHH